MVHLNKKKSKKGVPVIDYNYIFFGRHKEHKAAKYFTAFVLVFVVLFVAFYLPNIQVEQQQIQTVQLPELFFTPGMAIPEHEPEVVILNGNPAWEYSLSEGTVVGAVSTGTLAFSIKRYNLIAIETFDKKWVLVHKSEKIADMLLEPPDSQYLEVLRGEKLFTVHAGNGNLIFQVIKVDDECRYSQDITCTYVDPQEYFDSL